MSEKITATDKKNINTNSDFKHRTGLIVRVSNKRNIKRLMKFGVLHYTSSKMSYALLYVDTENLEQTIAKIEKENYVSSVEISHLRDLPIEYEGVLDQLKQEIEAKKEENGIDTFSNQYDFH